MSQIRDDAGEAIGKTFVDLGFVSAQDVADYWGRVAFDALVAAGLITDAGIPTVDD